MNLMNEGIRVLEDIHPSHSEVDDLFEEGESDFIDMSSHPF